MSVFVVLASGPSGIARAQAPAAAAAPVAAAAQGAAAPNDWSASFLPETIATYLPPTPSNLLVAEAGERSESSHKAALAVQAALRRSGRTRMVMDGAMIGATDGLSDPAVVGKCASLPIDLIAVLRVVPAGQGFAESATLSFYTRDGQLRLAASTNRGSPLPARARLEEPPVAAVAPPAWLPPAGGQPDYSMRRPPAPVLSPEQIAAQKEYDKHYIGFIHPLVDSDIDDAAPFLGIARKRLEDNALYEELGRPDLSARHNMKFRIQTGVVLGSLGLFTVGAVVSLAMAFIVDPKEPVCVALNPDHTCALIEESVVHPLDRGVGAGLGVTAMLLGAGGFFAGISVNSHPISAFEARALVAEHNRKLKLKLGLPVDDTLPHAALERSRVSFAPLPQSGGAGLALRYTF